MGIKIRHLVIFLLLGFSLLQVNAVAPPGVPVPSSVETQAAYVDTGRNEQLPKGAVLRFGSSRLRHVPGLAAVSFSPNGRFVITSGSFSHTGDGTFHESKRWGTAVWNAATGQLIRRFGRSETGVTGHAVTRDGKILAAADEGASIDFWDLAKGTHLHQIELPEGYSKRSMVFSPDGKVFACSGIGISLWEVCTGRKLRSWKLAEGSADEVCFSPDGTKLVVTASLAKKVYVYDSSSGREVHVWPVGKLLFKLFILPDGKEFIVAGEGIMQVRSLASGKLIREWKADSKESSAWAMALTPDGKLLATAAMRGVHLWHVATGKAAGRPLYYSAISQVPSALDITSLAFSPDGKTLASSFKMGLVTLWDVPSRTERLRRSGHEDSVRFAAYSPDGQHILSGGGDGTARLWKVRTGQQIFVTSFEEAICTGTISRRGTKAAIGAWDGRVHWFDLPTGKILKSWQAHPYYVGNLVILPDEQSVISASQGQVCKYDLRKKAILAKYQFGNPKNGPSLAIAHQNPMAIAWDSKFKLHLDAFPTGKRIWSRTLEDQTVNRLTFSPDDRFLAFGGAGDCIHLHNLSSGEEVTLGEELDREFLNALAFSSDGRWLASVEGYEIHVWELLTRKEVIHFRTEDHLAECVAFSPGKDRLVTGGADGTLLLWDCTSTATSQSSAMVSENVLQEQWNALSTTDARRAYAAFWTLAKIPKKSIPFLAKRIRPVICKPSLAHLIRDLDSDIFAVRDQASQVLQKHGTEAVPILTRTLAKGPTPEVKSRINQLLAHLGDLSVNPTFVRQNRILALLEYSHSPLAKATLVKLANGDPDAWVTQAALSSLERMTCPNGAGK